MPQPFRAPVVFGVLNVTPDSFSDGGRYLASDAAIGHGQALVQAGADVVDVGGESTRPGADVVDPFEERRRVVPVVEGLVAGGIRVSIDTRHGVVAEAAIAAGATIVNDVEGGRDPGLLRAVATSTADLVLMHSRGPSARDGGYEDVVREVRDDLRVRIDAAIAAGVQQDRLVIDPGIGFSKAPEENWRLLARLEDLRLDGLRMLVGVSRKRFLGELVEGDPDARDGVTAVVSALLADRDVWGVRVHDPASTRAAIEVVRRMREAA
jgi:dihydropteroate synthase